MSKDATDFLVLPKQLHKEALEKLTLREVQAVVDDAPIATFLTEELRIIAINRYAQPTFSQIPGALGMELPEFLRRYWSPDAADQTIAVFRNTLATGMPYSCIQFTAERKKVPGSESYNWEVHRLITADAKRMLICYFVRIAG